MQTTLRQFAAILRVAIQMKPVFNASNAILGSSFLWQKTSLPSTRGKILALNPGADHRNDYIQMFSSAITVQLCLINTSSIMQIASILSDLTSLRVCVCRTKKTCFYLSYDKLTPSTGSFRSPCTRLGTQTPARLNYGRRWRAECGS